MDVTTAATVDAFIAYDPSYVEIERRVRTTTDAGGWVWVHNETLPEQIGRKIEQPRNRIIRSMPDGREVLIDSLFVLPLDGDISVGDLLTIDDTTYEVVTVVHHKWSLKAELVRYGGGE